MIRLYLRIRLYLAELREERAWTGYLQQQHGYGPVVIAGSKEKAWALEQRK